MGRSPIAIVIIILVIATVISFSVFTGNGNATAQKTERLSYEQVKIFSEDCGGRQGCDKLETRVNNWIKDNADKTEILGVTQSGNATVTVITVRYKTR